MRLALAWLHPVGESSQVKRDRAGLLEAPDFLALEKGEAAGQENHPSCQVRVLGNTGRWVGTAEPQWAL